MKFNQVASSVLLEDLRLHHVDGDELLKVLQVSSIEHFLDLLESEHGKVGDAMQDQLTKICNLVEFIVDLSANLGCHKKEARSRLQAGRVLVDPKDLRAHGERLVGYIQQLKFYVSSNYASLLRAVQEFCNTFPGDTDGLPVQPEPSLSYDGNEIEAWLMVPAMQCLKVVQATEQGQKMPWRQLGFWAAELSAGCQLALQRSDPLQPRGLVNTPLRLQLCSGQPEELLFCIRRTFIDCVGGAVHKAAARSRSQPPISKAMRETSENDGYQTLKERAFSWQCDMQREGSNSPPVSTDAGTPSSAGDLTDLVEVADFAAGTGNGLNNGTTTWGSTSAGTIGHPHMCAEACKYVRRKGGCRDGTNCPCCHQCRWQRKRVHSDSKSDTTPDASTEGGLYSKSAGGAPTTAMAAAGLSIGSVGHPHACSLACKYHNKASGCKDGLECRRCHLCHWFRRMEKTPTTPPSLDEVDPAAMLQTGANDLQSVAGLMAAPRQSHPPPMTSAAPLLCCTAPTSGVSPWGCSPGGRAAKSRRAVRRLSASCGDVPATVVDA